MKRAVATLLSACVGSVVLGPVAHADILAAWDVSGINASATPVFTNTTSVAGITSNSTVLSLGAGVNASGAANTFGGSGFNDASLAVAITSNDYFSFFIVADPGNTLTITNIAWNFSNSGTGGSNLTLVSSYDGFTAQVFGETNFPLVAPFGDANFAVSSMTGSNSIEFRLYAYGTVTAGGVDRFRNLAGSDLTVQGTVTVVPEPASMLLFSTGAGVLAVIRRRRHAAS